MKRVLLQMVLISVLLLIGQHWASAQRPVGDTIIGADSTYMYYIYDWWRCANHEAEAPRWYTVTSGLLFGWAYKNNSIVRGAYSGPLGDPGGSHSAYEYAAGNDIRGLQMVTDRPIKIMGIATCAYAQQPSDTTISMWLYELHSGSSVPPNPAHLFPSMRDTTLAGRYTDSLLLLKPTDNGPTYLAGGPWRVEGPHRYLPLPMRIEAVAVDTTTWRAYPYTVYDSAPVVPLYEVMLDKPQVVTDSFIVAGTANNNEGSYGIQYLPNHEMYENMWLWNKRPTRYWGLAYRYHPQVEGIDTPTGYADSLYVVWYKYRDLPWLRVNLVTPTYVRGLNAPVATYYTHVIFPIIDPDFDTVLCDVVRDVRMADSTDTTLTLMWNGGNNVEWEVQYMEVNGWDLWTTTTTVPMVTLTGLRERTNYMVRVRGKCSWDTEFGEWSEWLDLFTGAHRNDPPQSVSNLERFTQMMPNPARGLVTVLSSYRLSRVVVYDLQGHAVLEQEDDGLATTIDVSGLAKGVYVVAIHTPAGIATKRLVVEGN